MVTTQGRNDSKSEARNVATIKWGLAKTAVGDDWTPSGRQKETNGWKL
jgi:hypothetical protein